MKKLLKYFGFGLMGYAFALCSVSQTNATTFTIDQVDGDWVNAQPSAAITIVNSASSGGLSTARWGNSMGYGKSGYDFLSRTTPFNAESNGTAFSLGSFTHLNFPITGTPLTSIDLLLNLQDIGIFNLSTTFNILHNETPNTTGRCVNNFDVFSCFLAFVSMYYQSKTCLPPRYRLRMLIMGVQAHVILIQNSPVCCLDLLQVHKD